MINKIDKMAEMGINRSEIDNEEDDDNDDWKRGVTMIRQVNPIIFDFLWKRIRKNKEITIGKYTFNLDYVVVLKDYYGYEKEIKVQGVQMDENENVNELVLSVSGINDKIITQVSINKRLAQMYFVPERSKMKIDEFVSTIYKKIREVMFQWLIK